MGGNDKIRSGQISDLPPRPTGMTAPRTPSSLKDKEYSLIHPTTVCNQQERGGMSHFFKHGKLYININTAP